MKPVSQFLSRHGLLLLAIGIAGSMELFLTLEWSFPYCNDQQDGPSSAVFGFPFPYLRWGGFSSLIYVFMPHVYLVNLLARSLLLLLLLRLVMNRLASASSTRTRTGMGVIGLVLCGAFMAWDGLLVGGGWMIPRRSIVQPWASYSELRPVRFSSTRHYDCTPSSYWFPAKWTPPR